MNQRLLKINNNNENLYINNYKKYIYNSSVIITADIILDIYDIITPEDLLKYINENIDNIFAITRIMMVWVRNNFDLLKIHNDFLCKIINIILECYLNHDLRRELNLKEIKEYISYWLNKNNKNNFILNLLHDIIEYYKKKYSK
jgi:hypothetical protein